MKKKLITLVMVCLCLASCKYKGDGEYTEEGSWLLKNYGLVLPSFSLVSGNQTKFYVGNFKTNTSIHIIFSMKSKYEINFDELDPVIEFKIADEKGENARIFKNEKLFSHYQRMKAASNALNYENDEWNCGFRWADKSFQYRTVPFSIDKPIAQKEIHCRTIVNSRWSEGIEFPKKNYYLIVTCIKCEDYRNLVGQLSLRSGWK